MMMLQRRYSRVLATLALVASTTGKFGEGFATVNRPLLRNPRTQDLSPPMMMPVTSEVSLLHDVSMLALDVSTVTAPNTAWLRLSNVIGRVVILTADYIQGSDNISPVEWTFQSFMLIVAAHLFIQSAWPLINAELSTSSLTVRDRRAYALMFRKVGLTILQFKTLLASGALDWIEYQPSESVILNGEYMYFLYSGEVTIPVSSNKIGDDEYVIGTSTDIIAPNISYTGDDIVDPCVSYRVFGDIEFAMAMEESVYAKNKKNNKGLLGQLDLGFLNRQDKSSSNEVPPSSCIVGSNGASALRIFTPKLLKLMENDDELSRSIQRLVLLCMHKKLSRTLRDVGLKSSAKVNKANLTQA